MKMKHLFLIVALLGMMSFVSLAQDDAAKTAEDYLARYEGIATERLEDGGFVLGNPEAPVTLVEFADFLCGHCQTYQATAHTFIETYVATGQARFEYRLFPVVDPTYSPYSAQLAECADEQQTGLFWPAHDYLYDLAIERNIGPDTAENMAALFELNVDALNTCAETADQFEIDQELGQSLGVSGTPATRLRVGDEIGLVRVSDQTIGSGGIPLEILELIMIAQEPADLLVVPEDTLTDVVTLAAECADVITGCWRGLVLGETPWEDALALILAEEQFGDLQEVEDEEQGIKAVAWRSIASRLQSYSQAVSIGGETLDFVALIDLSPYSVADVIEAHGEPEYALASPYEAGEAFAFLFYPNKSMIIQIYILETEGFTEASQLVGAQYNTPDRMTELLTEFAPAEWQGFEAFESYIQE